MTSVQEIAAEVERLRREGEKLIVAALNPLFDKHPYAKTVSFLNESTYNDEGYDMPSSKGWGRGFDTVVINEVDPYDLDDLTMDERDQWNDATTDFEEFYNDNANTLIKLFGHPTEIQFYRDRTSINVRIYEGAY